MLELRTTQARAGGEQRSYCRLSSAACMHLSAKLSFFFSFFFHFERDRVSQRSIITADTTRRMMLAPRDTRYSVQGISTGVAAAVSVYRSPADTYTPAARTSALH
jgi:hypothetical protein